MGMLKKMVGEMVQRVYYWIKGGRLKS